jgi:hypothetical protein
MIYKALLAKCLCLALITVNFAAVVSPSVVSAVDVPESNLESLDYVEGEVIVKFYERQVDLDRSSGELVLNEIAEELDADAVATIPGLNVAMLSSNGNQSTMDLIEELSDNPLIEIVEPNYIRTLLLMIQVMLRNGILKMKLLVNLVWMMQILIG